MDEAIGVAPAGAADGDRSLADAAERAVDFDALLRRGFAAHETGELDVAKSAYRKALANRPGHAAAIHLLGLVHHQQNDHEEAISLIVEAIRLNPDQPAYHANLGAAFLSMERLEDAAEQFERAIELRPDDAALLSNLALTLERQGRPDRALEILTEAVSLAPDNTDYRRRMGQLQARLDHDCEAVRTLSVVAAERPDDASVANALGRAYERMGQLERAEAAYARAFDLSPKEERIAYNLAKVRLRLDRHDEAAAMAIATVRETCEYWSRALTVGRELHRIGRSTLARKVYEAISGAIEDDLDVWYEYGQVCNATGQCDRAIACFDRGLELSEDNFRFLIAKGQAHIAVQQPEEAVAIFERAYALKPTHIQALTGLVSAYAKSKNLDRANMWARRVMLGGKGNRDLFPSVSGIFQSSCDYSLMQELGDPVDLVANARDHSLSAALLCLLAQVDTPERTGILMDIARRAGKAMERRTTIEPLPPLARRAPHRRKRPDKLRIGFLSSDLRAHSVAKFVMPLIESYDRDALEFFVYSPFPGQPDKTEKKVIEAVEGYRSVAQQSNNEMVETIRADEIDILMELNGATAYTRIHALAHRAAPIQIEWLGYPFTTGFREMDYFLVDPHLRPEGDDLLYEKPLIMPRSWICYTKYLLRRVNPIAPATRSKHVTFGTLNNTYKYSRKAIALWARVLKATPNSRFIFMRPESASAILRVNIAREFARHGIDAGRIEFFNNRLNRIPFEECYNHIDISLDTTPLTGGTTSVECLDMGVPLVSLRGPAMHQRISHAILNHVEMAELSVGDEDDFVERAAGLADNIPYLAACRRHLREQVRESVLCDAGGFATDFRDVMWNLAREKGVA